MLVECRQEKEVNDFIHQLGEQLRRNLQRARERGGRLYISADFGVSDCANALTRHFWNGYAINVLRGWMQANAQPVKFVKYVSWMEVETSAGCTVTVEQLIDFSRPHDVARGTWSSRFGLAEKARAYDEATRKQHAEQHPLPSAGPAEHLRRFGVEVEGR